METQSQVAPEFTPGTQVIYGMHGRCNILAIETRTLGSETIPFYKLEVQKSALSRSHRQEPAIWVPVASAKDQGLRSPIIGTQAEEVWKILSSREFYFQIDESWSSVQAKMEKTIRREGAIGLAKVASYLHVLKKRQVVTAAEVTRMQEMVSKLLLRELSEASGEATKVLEEKMNKAFRQKLIPDS